MSHAQQSSESSLSLTPRKKLLFSSVLALIPLVFFLLLELILRASNYGPDLSLFTSRVIAGKEYLIMNPAVKSRFFNQVDFTPTTSPEYFLMPKPEGTFRIFCLGGSTTVGYPYWYNGSFSSFLRDRLKRIFPEKNVEIINLGMTATNSFTVLDFARDLVDYEPDLFLVYDGHNEFYGALGVSSHETAGSSRWSTVLYLRLVHLRTFQLVRSIVESLSGLFGRTTAPVSRAGTMMEQMSRGNYIAYHDERYQEALSTFRQNLLNLRSLTTDSGIPLLLGTQVSNLRDHSPFVSTSHDSWPLAAQQEFSESLIAARSLVANSSFGRARPILENLVQKDSTHAETHFLLARCLEGNHEYDSARVEYVRARDYDELRFRMSSEFNAAIDAMSNPPAIDVVDMEKVFADASPNALIGNNLITEHLHPNARGYFLMARAYAEAIRSMNVLGSPEQWSQRDTLSDETLWKARSLTEVDQMLAERRTEVLTSGWPFKNQYPIVDAVAETDTLRFIAEQATRGLWDWKKTHQEAAEYYLSRGDVKKAEKEYKTIIDQIPLDVSSYLRLARVQLDQNLIGEARRTLLFSLTLQETPLALRALGDIALQATRAGDAIRYYEKLEQYSQTPKERDENRYLLALAYLQSNNPDAATTVLQKLLRENPENAQANALLARIREVAAQQGLPR